MWDKYKAGKFITIGSLLEGVLKNKELIDTVCIVGGEPTDQLVPLKCLLYDLQHYPFDVWVYSGREADTFEIQTILPYCTFIKCGKYIENAKSTTSTTPTELEGIISLASDNQYIIRGGRLNADKFHYGA